MRKRIKDRGGKEYQPQEDVRGKERKKIRKEERQEDSGKRLIYRGEKMIDERQKKTGVG
jgi:hypothetical protein